MASITVAQLKTAVANIPVGANSWLIEMPDGLVVMVGTGRVVDSKGVATFTVLRGFLALSRLKWKPV